MPPRCTLEASRKFELPPLQVLGYCLKLQLGMSHHEVQVALDEPEIYLSSKMQHQFQSARSADGVTETLSQSARTKAFATGFEIAVKTRLQRAGISFLTEEEQTREAREAGTGQAPTPDFLIGSNRADVDADVGLLIALSGYEVRWIEVKNYFGSALGYHGKKLRKQLSNYSRLYGPGAVVFSIGAGESIHQVLPSDVVVLAAPGGGHPPPL